MEAGDCLVEFFQETGANHGKVGSIQLSVSDKLKL
jgi:hypothetical protein